jgi:hypothetical protein
MARLVEPKSLVVWMRWLAMKETKSIHESGAELHMMLKRRQDEHNTQGRISNRSTDRTSMNEFAFGQRLVNLSSILDAAL